MFTQNNRFGAHKSSTSAWEKFIAICSQTVGGFYRPDGTILKTADSSEKTHRESDHTQGMEYANLVQRTHQRVRHQEMVRQINLENILSRAYNLMGPDCSIRDVDKDWANLFFGYAQDISNSSMQALWAEAIVLEIAHPQSISKHSLTFLHNCDIWEIKAFRKVAASAFIAGNGHPFIFKTNNQLSANDPIFSEQRLLSHCVSAGLVSDEPIPLPAGFKFNYAGQCQVVLQVHNPIGGEVGYYVQRFTRVGSDLYRLVSAASTSAKSRLQKRLVWDFLTDYLELERI